MSIETSRKPDSDLQKPQVESEATASPGGGVSTLTSDRLKHEAGDCAEAQTSERAQGRTAERPTGSKVDLSQYGWRTEPRSGESAYFADPHSVREGVAELRKVEGLQADAQTWQKMTDGDRIAVLQAAEDRMAKVQCRPTERVYGERMADNEYGEFRGGPRRGIYVNTHPTLFNSLPESLNTVVHEGRHAYQLQAVEEPGLHPDTDRVRQWKSNDKQPKTIGEHGPEAYMKQPREYDAGAYGFAVTEALYPEYQPSQSRIDLYNSNNAQSIYGYLKTSEQSQKVTSSDPARFDMRTRKGREAT